MQEGTTTSKTVEKDGITKTVSVEEVMNGYIIEIRKSGDKDGEYYHETEKYISKSNPLDSKEEEAEDSGLMDAIKNLKIHS